MPSSVGTAFRCPVCKVGKLQRRTAGLKRSSLSRLCDVPVGDTDIVRRRMCDWCAVHLVTVERIAGMVTPPNEEKIKELEEGKRDSKRGNLRNPWI